MRLLALVGCVLACSTLARAADPRPPKPGPEQEKLKKFEGQWDCVVKFGDMEMKGTATYKLGYGGFWLTQHFKAEGGDFEGRGAMGYDPNLKKYVTTWIDSESPSMMLMHGNFDKDGKYTETGDMVDMEGKPIKGKAQIEFKDKDNFVYTLSTVKDGKDEVMLTVTYKRKK